MLALSTALSCAGCSFSDFDYLSDDFGGAGSGASAGSAGAGAGAGGAAGAGAMVGGGSGGSDAGMAGQAGAEPMGGGGAGGSSNVEGQFFCMPAYYVFDKAHETPPVDLPATGKYLIRKEASPSNACLLTPDWPELGDKQYWALTRECGGPPTANPAQPEAIWHLEHLCSDVYRFTSYHDSASERQLAMTDFSMVGTPLYSVASERNLDPAMVFHLRFEALVGETVRWRFSPAIDIGNCIEEADMRRYGEMDVTRVVHYPCTGNFGSQSWNLVAVP